MNEHRSHREPATERGEGPPDTRSGFICVHTLSALCNVAQCLVIKRLVLTSMPVTGGKRANSGKDNNFYTLVEVTSKQEQLDGIICTEKCDGRELR